MAGQTDDGLTPRAAPIDEVEAEQPPTESTHDKDRDKTGRHGKVHTIVALSIATVSVLGAIASWRIETHASAASELDQSAVAATITDSRLLVEARAEAQQSEEAYFRYERLSGEAQQLAPGGCPNNPVSVLDYNAYVVCEMQRAIFDGGNDQYVSANGRNYNIDALTRDLVAENGFQEDHQPGPYEAEAVVERHAEDRLLLLALVLVLSLALLTVAHLARRRKMLLRTAIPAWVLIAISTALLVVWEV
jgi:hypothetical protein